MHFCNLSDMSYDFIILLIINERCQVALVFSGFSHDLKQFLQILPAALKQWKRLKKTHSYTKSVLQFAQCHIKQQVLITKLFYTLQKYN